MKSKKLLCVMCICMVSVAMLLSACGSDDPDEICTLPEPGSEADVSDDQVTDVSIVSTVDENGNNYATITGTDAGGSTIWTVETDGYPAAQLDAFTGIGKYEDQYYYVESGKVVALDVQTGTKIWENPDFGGAPTEQCCVIDSENGNVYLSGFFGPDFYSVDKNGKTLKRIEQVNEKYFWPSNLTVKGDDVTIVMTGSDEGEKRTEVYFDLNDY